MIKAIRKTVLASIAILMAIPAFAQIGRIERGIDQRGPGGRVVCTIQTREKGSVTGVGRDCYDAIADAQNLCTRIIRPENHKRCFNAGRIPNAMFSIRCDDRFGAGACRHVLPYSF